MTEFLCPHCLVSRPFETKRISKEITLYEIPILVFEMNERTRAVICRVCQNAFHSDVLKYNTQFLFKVAGAAKSQLDGGISPGYLKLQLISDGLKESFVDKLLTLAQH
jgi:hypothetical protein